MQNLYNSFHISLTKILSGTLPGSIRKQALHFLRFQIGGNEKIYLGDHRKPNGAYVENAVDRAMKLYSCLPAAPDILRIDDCPGLFLPGLPKPDQCQGASCFWNLKKESGFLRNLFREIIRAEIDPAGNDNLVSNVYFLNSERYILFHLADDRWADVAVAEESDLKPLLDSCSNWILELPESGS